MEQEVRLLVVRVTALEMIIVQLVYTVQNPTESLNEIPPVLIGHERIA